MKPEPILVLATALSIASHLIGEPRDVPRFDHFPEPGPYSPAWTSWAAAGTAIPLSFGSNSRGYWRPDDGS